MATDDSGHAPPDTELREHAIKHLKKKRDFWGHLLIYTMVNAFFVAVWAVTTPDGFFWPIFPIVGWGIGVVANAWDAFRSDDFSETQVRREMQRLRRRA